MLKPKFLGSPTHPLVSRVEGENFARQGTSKERSWTIPVVYQLPLAVTLDLRPCQNLRRPDLRHTPLLPQEPLLLLPELEQQQQH